MKYPTYLDSFAYKIADDILEKLKIAYETGFIDGKAEIGRRAEAILEVIKADNEESIKKEG